MMIQLLLLLFGVDCDSIGLVVILVKVLGSGNSRDFVATGMVRKN